MKYKLTHNTMTTEDGIVLHRIQAFRNIGKDVKAGELGGWIEKKGNLSQYGKCWVRNNAKVAGKARVCGNAGVYGKAYIYDNA